MSGAENLFSRSIEASPYVIDELRKQAINAGGGVDPATAAMFRETLNRYEAGSENIRTIVGLASWNHPEPHKNKGALVAALRTKLVYYFRMRATEDGHDFSDVELTSPDQWSGWFDKLESDYESHSGPSGAFNYLLINKEYGAATPVVPRYFLPEMFAQLIGAKSMLDIGTSLGVGPIAMLNKQVFDDSFPFAFRRLITPSGEKITAKANALISRPTPIKKIVGVDRLPVFKEARAGKLNQYDPVTAEYAISGLRPHERIINGQETPYLKLVKKLMDIKLEWSRNGGEQPMEFFEGNFAGRNAEEDLERFKETHGSSFDLIVLSYIWQDLVGNTPEETRRVRHQMHDVALDLLSPNGLIIYQHEAYLPVGAPQPAPIEAVTQLASYAEKENTSHQHVAGLISGTSKDRKGVVETMTSSDNRWMKDLKIVNNLARIATGHGELSLAEAIKRA